ncbi:mevalonate kinase-like isoform X1 [Zingiber officinale]|uniref:mevalonate kinase-like isoform X1 n=2 Tax=Zingiber officinale TaxID=94328 RepID=UPI001C4C56DC|nr:mevalonate kinase-like isoform X1 [Zingiber officinale]
MFLSTGSNGERIHQNSVEVRARAPGKIILSGEHAVVHGSTAIAAAIDLHTHVSFRLDPSLPPGDEESAVDLELKDMALKFSWPSSKLREVLDDAVADPSNPASCSLERIKSISALVEEPIIPEAMIWLSSGVSAFLHLYTSIHGYKRGKVVVTSDLPLGSGLGSSSSFCVSLAGALLSLTDAVSFDKSQTGWFKLTKAELELVNKWAFEGEKIIHGKPSGIDNTISTFGSMIQFKSGELIQIKSSAPLRMLITNTKVGRNTKVLVAGVSGRSSRHLVAMSSVFTAVDCISKELLTILESPAADDISVTAREEKIEELLEMNQGLLQCMGVSHSSIETVLQTTLKYKLTSKLTGAGGGGCVLTLLPTLLSCSIVDKVIAELESCGFQCLKAEVGGEGLEIFSR